MRPGGQGWAFELKNWQLISVLLTIVATSVALATPWVRYQAKDAVQPAISEIQGELKNTADRLARGEERDKSAKELENQHYQDLRTDLRDLQTDIKKLLAKGK